MEYNALQSPAADRAARLRHAMQTPGVVTTVAPELVVMQQLPTGLEDESPSFRYPFAGLAEQAIGANAQVFVAVRNPLGSDCVATVIMEAYATAGGPYAWLQIGTAAYAPAASQTIPVRDSRVESCPLLIERYAGAIVGHLRAFHRRLLSATISQVFPAVVLHPGWWVRVEDQGVGTTLLVQSVGSWRRAASLDELRAL